MNKSCRNNDGKKVCPKCGVVVSNLRKHKARNRCQVQHIRKPERKKQLRLEKIIKQMKFQQRHNPYVIDDE